MTDRFKFHTEKELVKNHDIRTYDLCNYCGNFHQMEFVCWQKQMAIGERDG